MRAMAYKHRLIGQIFRSMEALQEVVNVHVDETSGREGEVVNPGDFWNRYVVSERQEVKAARRRITGLLRELEPWGIVADCVAEAVAEYQRMCEADDYRPPEPPRTPAKAAAVSNLLSERDAAVAALGEDAAASAACKAYYERQIAALFAVKEDDDAFDYE